MNGEQPSSSLHWTIAGAIALLLYLGYLAIYRLYLSPISSFPGPKLAALTLWYEFYHDVVRGGQYVFKINELHDQYGRPSHSTSVIYNLSQQAQSFASSRMKSIFQIQTSTMNFLLQLPHTRSPVTGFTGLAMVVHYLILLTMHITINAALRWPCSSHALKSWHSVTTCKNKLTSWSIDCYENLEARSSVLIRLLMH